MIGCRSSHNIAPLRCDVGETNGDKNSLVKQTASKENGTFPGRIINLLAPAPIKDDFRIHEEAKHKSFGSRSKICSRSTSQFQPTGRIETAGR